MEPQHIDSRGYLKPERYSEPSQRFQMECFEKIVKSYNYFSKAYYLRSWTGLWIRSSLNKYSLAWRMTSRYVLYLTYTEPYRTLSIVNSDIFRRIHVLLRHIEPCRDVFRNLSYSYIFRTLPFSESWHV